MIRLRLGWLDGLTADRDSLCRDMDEALMRGASFSVGFVNPHVFVTAEQAPVVRDFLSACDRICIDGLGIVIAHRLFGRARLPRVVAEQLFRAHWTGSAVRADALLIGIEADDIERAAVALNEASDSLRVVGTLHGFADDEAIDAFVTVSSSEPDNATGNARYVLIGAGSPRSEAIAARVRAARPDALIFHCGAGTLKTWAGAKRRAPAQVSRWGLEWVHRIVFEPHARARYLLGGPRFLAALWRARTTRHHLGVRSS